MYEDIDDIEDLVAPGDLLPSDRYNNKKDIVIRKRKTTRVTENNSDEKENECKNQQNGSVSCSFFAISPISLSAHPIQT